MAFLYDRSDYGMQSGLLFAEDLQGRKRRGDEDLGTMHGQNQHPDDDNDADGVQASGLPLQNREDTGKRENDRYAGRRDRAANTVYFGLFLKDFL